MPRRLALLPMLDGTWQGAPARSPAYIAALLDGAPAPVIVPDWWRLADYGTEGSALVALMITSTQATTLNAQPNVLLFPANLDLTVGANLAALQAALEARNFPAAHVTTETTYRAVVRQLNALCHLLQRFAGASAALERLFGAGVTFSTTLGQLTAQQRQRLQAAADRLGFSTAGLTGTSTIRQYLRAMMAQARDTAMEA